MSAHGFVFSFCSLAVFWMVACIGCNTYLDTNIVQNCSYIGFGGYFLVAGTIFWSLTNRIKRIKQMKRAIMANENDSGELESAERSKISTVKT